ncbi:MAG: hypothetical protein CMJ14_03270 [Pelagibacterales bacterium]|nr:hypothetical protein [Pelagibacterales bacterium]|tara:strand:- start:387 stop:587 length:201 start_codon:yes stop_codon:yes gene_type:complete
MKKLAILTLLTTFLTSQVFAAMWTPHPVECYDCAIDLKSPLKVLAGYGDIDYMIKHRTGVLPKHMN